MSVTKPIAERFAACRGMQLIGKLFLGSLIFYGLGFSQKQVPAALAQTTNDNTPNPNDFDNFGAAFNELKRNDNIQFEFTTVPPPPETPRWLEVIGDFFNGIFSFIAAIIELFSPLIHIIFWLGIGAFCMAVLYLIITTLLAARIGERAKKDTQEAPALYRPEQSQARVLLAEIDALAAQGKYAEAVHTLLFRSIQDIDLNRPNVIRRSLTSREIAELKILTAQSREVFSNIASVVERSFFGGQDIDKADFDTARAGYVNLTDPAGHRPGQTSKKWTANNTLSAGA